MIEENSIFINIGYYKNKFGCLKKVNKIFNSILGYLDEEILN